MACYRGEYTPAHPAFSKNSAAVCKGGDDHDVRPVDIGAPDIQYTAEDEEAIEEYTRKSGGQSIVLLNLLPF